LARIVLHKHAWPLVITVIPSEFDLRDIEAYIPEVDALYKRRERFASLVDTTPLVSLPGASERRRLAEWQNATIDSIRRYNVFSAIVIRSPVVRGAMTAMNWIFRPPAEQLTLATFGEGFLRCIERLRADGRPARPELERMAREAPPASVEDTLATGPGARSDTSADRLRGRGG